MRITEALTSRTSGLRTPTTTSPRPAGKMLQQVKVLPKDPIWSWDPPCARRARKPLQVVLGPHRGWGTLPPLRGLYINIKTKIIINQIHRIKIKNENQHSKSGNSRDRSIIV